MAEQVGFSIIDKMIGSKRSIEKLHPGAMAIDIPPQNRNMVVTRAVETAGILRRTYLVSRTDIKVTEVDVWVRFGKFQLVSATTRDEAFQFTYEADIGDVT